jgi:hypothetical protein
MPDVDLAYPTVRYFNNVGEGKAPRGPSSPSGPHARDETNGDDTVVASSKDPDFT